MTQTYVRDLVVRYPLISYFTLTYLITWAFLIPFVYLWRVTLEQTFEPWLLIFLPGAYGPSIAAIIVTRIQKGSQGVRALLSKLLIWRVYWKWYVFVLFAPMVLLLASIAISNYQIPEIGLVDLPNFLMGIPLHLLLALPFGPMAEELGWRGFALPKLQTRFTPMVSSIILGVIWTFWHTPMFWFPGAAIPSFMELSVFAVLLYLLQTLAEAILFTLVFNYTRASVLIAILFHTTINATENIVFSVLPEPVVEQEWQLYLYNLLLMWVLVALCVAVTRGKLK